MKKRSVIALITDFGLDDGYVASMKGVILTLSPAAQIIDITHSIEPGNVDQAAFLLWTTFNYFPKGTIFVCVVDPGVGSKRNILCVQTNNHCFLAPDNGVLKFVLGSIRAKTIISVTQKKYFSKEISNTFHGRDIFAPVAAHLFNGLSIGKLGAETTPVTAKEHFVEIVAASKKTYAGKIIHIDRFGNIITNFHSRRFSTLRSRLQIGKTTIHRFSRTYAEAESKYPFLTIGSSMLLEISFRNGNAARLLNAKMNQRVRLRME
jgi:S-adenosylmethionine hydrolase